MTPADFVHLHVHTQYSLLDGAVPIDALLNRAREYAMPAVAVTDHGNMCGAVKFYQKAHELGITPIIGCEVYCAPKSRLERDPSAGPHTPFHMTLLTSDTTGYRNLVRLVSRAHTEGFHHRPRIDRELLAQLSKGLIGLSGCLSGEVPTLLSAGDIKKAAMVCGTYSEIFGPGNFFLEVQDNGIPQQAEVNRGLIELGRRLSLPLVATNDCHYLNPNDAKAHDILLCLQTGKTIHDSNRMRFGSEEFYFKSSQQMIDAFRDLPEAVANTRLIAERCRIDLGLGHTYLPDYQVPDGSTKEGYCERLARSGLAERLRHSRDPRFSRETYEQRVTEELAIITSMGYAGVFLIVWDIVTFARSRGIPVGPGRGSAAGSLVAYALTITDIDPLRYGLLFERFLNPERITLPDIDIDFCAEKRGEVISYITEKYGSDHVSQIITFNTMAAKAVLRDVGRVLEIPYAQVDQVVKLIDQTTRMASSSPDMSVVKEAFKEEPRLAETIENDPRIEELLRYATPLEGTMRHASTHASGVVISKEPLTDIVPLYRGAKGEILTQYTGDDIEKIGLLKFDILGLQTLTLINHTLRMIRQNGANLDLSSLPLDDKKTYELLVSGSTTGIFQLESSGMKELLIRVKPDRIEDLIAVLALYRPGPLGSGADEFVKRKRGLTPITYDPPQLEEVLADTYGVILYQEQVIQIAHRVAGFSLGEADLFRRAMAKKLPEEMEKLKAPFLSRTEKRGIPRQGAEKLFDQMFFFAGYAFNRSHSTAYALLSYQTAYLKAHYPYEFMAALLTAEKGNTDKIGRYIGECRQMGIKILPPDINESQSDFTVVPEGIRFGLTAIKDVGATAVEAILMAREAVGRFRSLYDLCRTVDLRKVNRRALEGLIKAGAFDSTGAKRSQLVASLDQAIEEGHRSQKAQSDGQMSFLSSLEVPEETKETLPSLPEWDDITLQRLEKEALGFYITTHPLTRYSHIIKKISPLTTADMTEALDGKEVTLCGIITAQKTTTTKKGEVMAYVRLEDLMGFIEVILFPDLYKDVSSLIISDLPLVVTGTLDKGEKGIKIKATKIYSLPDSEKRSAPALSLHLISTDVSTEDLKWLKEILVKYPGPSPVSLTIVVPPCEEFLIETSLTVDPSHSLTKEIEQRFGMGVISTR